MKKIIMFVLMTGVLFAETKSDVALTIGYNKFDDPDFLRKGRTFYGIRGGMYQDNGFGYQVGYEQANGANCEGLNLRRIFTNALYITKQPSGFNPYGVVSAGYEMSTIDAHKPDQIFAGAGVGLRKELTEHINGFIETRVLRKLKSNDTDIITTLGLAYALKNRLPHYPEQKVMEQSVIVQPVVTQEIQEPMVENAPVVEVAEETQKHYYVQLAALAKTNPDSYVAKLYAQGIDNVHIKEVHVRGRALSLIMVGPFYDREEALECLQGLKRVSRGAFIVKF